MTGEGTCDLFEGEVFPRIASAMLSALPPADQSAARFGAPVSVRLFQLRVSTMVVVSVDGGAWVDVGGSEDLRGAMIDVIAAAARSCGWEVRTAQGYGVSPLSRRKGR